MINCPLCSKQMTPEQIRGTTLAVCAACDGMWLVHGQLDRLTESAIESEIDRWVHEPNECRYCRSALGFSNDCLTCGKPPTIQCPQGHGTMHTTLVDVLGAEIELDHCMSCRGIWMDGHERTHVDDTPPSSAGGARIRSTARLSQLAPKPGREEIFLDAMRSSPLGMELRGSMLIGGPDPHWFGRAEPFSLLVFLLFLGGLGAAVYWFVMPILQGF